MIDEKAFAQVGEELRDVPFASGGALARRAIVRYLELTQATQHTTSTLHLQGAYEPPSSPEAALANEGTSAVGTGKPLGALDGLETHGKQEREGVRITSPVCGIRIVVPGGGSFHCERHRGHTGQHERRLHP